MTISARNEDQTLFEELADLYLGCQLVLHALAMEQKLCDDVMELLRWPGKRVASHLD